MPQSKKDMRNRENKKLEAAGLKTALTKSGVPVKAPREQKQCNICKMQLVASATVALKQHADNKHPKNTFEAVCPVTKVHTGTKDAPRAISAQIPALALYRDGCRPLPSGGGSLFSSYRRSLEVASHKHWQGKPIANQASGQSENETSGPLPRIFCAVGGRSELRRIRIHPPTTRPTSQPASEPADRVVLASVGISGSSLLLSGTGTGHRAEQQLALDNFSLIPKRSMSQRKRKTSGGQSPPTSPGKTGSTIARTDHKTDKPPQSNASVRMIWTLIMIAGLLALLAAGHLWIILFLTVVQVMIFNEILAIAAVPAKENQIPWFKAINWYFLATTLYFAYGETVVYYFKHIVLVDALLLPFATHHRFISFILYIIGFVWFVGSLQSGQYRFQFSQFSFTHMTLILVVGQAHFIINNLLEGIYWFLIPASLVIANDCFAYVCGKLFGKHKLLELSPKKTVEGFIGAWFCTGFIGLIVSNVFMTMDYFICPATDLGANFFTGLQCEPNPVFLTKTFDLPPSFLNLHPLLSFIPKHVNIAPIQLHLMVLCTFASLIAPFGGFFASGLKRAFKIKDFGDSIPGHGGMTDRMDCQILNGFFVYLYYQSFIAVKRETVGDLLGAAVMGLSNEDIMILIQKLASVLRNRGIEVPLGPLVS